MSGLRIGIVGLGLIGGSLGLALKAALTDKVIITGIDRSTTSATDALRRGAVDRAEAELEAIGAQDVIFICTPVLQIVPVLQRLIPYLAAGTLITDVGSTKQYVWEQLQSMIPEKLSYMGGHPMAGREKSGMEAADKELFINKWYILGQGIHANPAQYQLLTELLQATGAKVMEMPAQDHDCAAACMSHIPHVAAAALVNLLPLQANQENLLRLMGGGFRDTTRIASSDADMWADICLTNKAAIAAGLKEYQQIIEEVICAMEQGNRARLHDFFNAAKQTRDDMLKQES